MSSRTDREQSAATWPDIWSDGQVCAFSGLDGPTHWSSAVGGRMIGEQCGFVFDTQPAIKLVIRALLDGAPVLDTLPAAQQECRIAAAGVEFSLPLADGRLDVRLAFDGSESFAGHITAATTAAHRLTVLVELQSDEASRIGPSRLVTPGRQLRADFTPDGLQRALPSDAVAAALTDPKRFEAAAKAYEGRPEPWSCLARIDLDIAASGQAETGFTLVFDQDGELGEPDGRSVESLLCKAPPPPDRLAGMSSAILRARSKAIAILRANCFAPEGSFGRHWIVPQRTKHRNFNTFHAPFLALGALHFDPELATNVLRAALGQQQANGMVPEQAWPTGQSVDTPPPLLCWGFWRVYQTVQDRPLLEDYLSRLKDYVKYPLAARLLERLGHARSHGARFLTWGRGEGSNMDNSPRFDINEPFAAIDLTCYAVAELELVARFIEELMPEHREAVHLGWMAEELASEVQEYFWHEQHGFFYDRYPDGDWVMPRTLAGVIPLFAGVASAPQAKELVERHLKDPKQFWTAFPLASLAADDSRYDQNMWRGGAWPGMNLLILHGLRRYGYHEVAEELRQRTLDGLAEWYLKTGSLWEFYDSSGQRSPADLPRGRRTGALPDYGWTAATFLALLDEPVG